MQVDLKTLTLEQLKALAYDQIALMETVQKNLKLINDQIAIKSQEPVEISTKKPK